MGSHPWLHLAAPSRGFVARCGRNSLFTVHCSLFTSHFSLLTSHFPLPTSHFPLPTSHFPLPTSHFPLLTSHFPLPTSHFPLPTSHFPLLTSHFSLPTSHFPLPTPHFPPFPERLRDSLPVGYRPMALTFCCFGCFGGSGLRSRAWARSRKACGRCQSAGAARNTPCATLAARPLTVTGGSTSPARLSCFIKVLKRTSRPAGFRPAAHQLLPAYLRDSPSWQLSKTAAAGEEVARRSRAPSSLPDQNMAGSSRPANRLGLHSAVLHAANCGCSSLPSSSRHSPSFLHSCLCRPSGC